MAGNDLDINRQARAALDVVVREHGIAGLSDPQVMVSMLRDLMPDSYRESNILIAAAEADVPGMLRDRQAQHVGTGAAVTQAAALLEERTALSPDACQWAVWLMAEVIGLPMDAPPQPQPGPAPYPPTQTLPPPQPSQSWPGPVLYPQTQPPPQPGPAPYPQTQPPPWSGSEPPPQHWSGPPPQPQPQPQSWPGSQPPPQSRPSPRPDPRPLAARQGPALVSGLAALICALSVPLQLLGHGLVNMPYGWNISLCGLTLFIAAMLTLQGRFRSLGAGLIFGAALAVMPIFAEQSVVSGYGGGYVAGSVLTAVTALIAAISSIVYFAPQIRGANLRDPLALAYVLAGIGLVVAYNPGFLQYQSGSSWLTYPGLVGSGIHGRFLFAGLVSLLALALPAVVAGLLPSGTGVRAGVIIGWLTVIAAGLIGTSLAAATLSGVRPAPAFYVCWVFWLIALVLGVALLARDRGRRAASTQPSLVS